MQRRDDSTGLMRATLVGVGLFAVSTGLLGLADEALDVTAIAGGIGVVMSGALLGLTILVSRWRVESTSYVTTTMVDETRGTVIAEAFDDPAGDLPLDDAAAI